MVKKIKDLDQKIIEVENNLKNVKMSNNQAEIDEINLKIQRQ